MAKTSRRVAALVAALALTQGLTSDPASAIRRPCNDEVPVCAQLDVSGIPKECRVRRFDVAVSFPSYARFEHIDVRLDGELIRRSRSRSFSVTISCRDLSPGTHRIKVAAYPRSDSPWFGEESHKFVVLD